jgi:hypothetical protein
VSATVNFLKKLTWHSSKQFAKTLSVCLALRHHIIIFLFIKMNTIRLAFSQSNWILMSPLNPFNFITMSDKLFSRFFFHSLSLSLSHALKCETNVEVARGIVRLLLESHMHRANMNRFLFDSFLLERRKCVALSMRNVKR